MLWRPGSGGLRLTTSGVIGSFLTSQLGSGSDRILYVFGTFLWNNLDPLEKGERPIPESKLTASTVMGAMSAITVKVAFRFCY